MADDFDEIRADVKRPDILRRCDLCSHAQDDHGGFGCCASTLNGTCECRLRPWQVFRRRQLLGKAQTA